MTAHAAQEREASNAVKCLPSPSIRADSARQVPNRTDKPLYPSVIFVQILGGTSRRFGWERYAKARWHCLWHRGDTTSQPAAGARAPARDSRVDLPGGAGWGRKGGATAGQSGRQPDLAQPDRVGTGDPFTGQTLRRGGFRPARDPGSAEHLCARLNHCRPRWRTADDGRAAACLVVPGNSPVALPSADPRHPAHRAFGIDRVGDRPFCCAGRNGQRRRRRDGQRGRRLAARAAGGNRDSQHHGRPQRLGARSASHVWRDHRSRRRLRGGRGPWPRGSQAVAGARERTARPGTLPGAGVAGLQRAAAAAFGYSAGSRSR